MTKNAMIVDDSRVARLMLKKLLIADDFNVVECDSGETALDYLVANESQPDIIFMDVMMKGMDGLRATRKIKEDNRLSAIPIVIFTSNDTEEDVQSAKKSGAISLLSKPPEPQALATILANINQTSTSTTDDVEELPEKQIKPTPAQQQSPNITEQTSQKNVTELTEKLVREQIAKQLVVVGASVQKELIKHLKSRIEIMAQQACKQEAERTTGKSASTVVDQTDMSAHIKQFLSQQGEEWLTEQEEELGQQLSLQLELHIPAMVSQHLDESLRPMVNSIVTEQVTNLTANSDTPLSIEAVELIHDESDTPLSLEHQQISTIIHSRVNQQIIEISSDYNEKIRRLTGKLALNKKLTIGLGIMMFGLLAVMDIFAIFK